MSVYLKKANMANVGPIDSLEINFNFDEENRPTPLLVVGANGTGKTLFLAQIINSFISAKQQLYTNVEVENGKLYKYRSPDYVKSGANHYYSEILYTNDLRQAEIQLLGFKDTYREKNLPLPDYPILEKLPLADPSIVDNNFNQRENVAQVKALIDSQCVLYFPANRFEEPAWLNLKNLNATAKLTTFKKFEGVSGRELICLSPMEKIKDWLLDVMCDTYLRDLHKINLGTDVQHVGVYGLNVEGVNKKLWDSLKQILEIVLGEKDLMLIMGDRFNRKIQIYRNRQLWIPNIFQLSMGQIQLLNIFFNYT